MSTIILVLFALVLAGTALIIAAAVSPSVSKFFDWVRAAAICIGNCVKGV